MKNAVAYVFFKRYNAVAIENRKEKDRCFCIERRIIHMDRSELYALLDFPQEVAEELHGY